MPWDPRTKPPADFCPGRYCFHWVPPGGAADVSGQGFRSVGEALIRGKWKAFPDGGCGCHLGPCTRDDPTNGGCDRYESNQYELDRDGLPWFYFYPSTDGMNAAAAARYRVDSAAQWGAGHDAGPPGGA